MSLPTVKQENPFISLYEQGNKHKMNDPIFVIRHQTEKEWFAGYYKEVDGKEVPAFSSDPQLAIMYWMVSATAPEISKLSVQYNIDAIVLCRPGRKII